MTKFKQDLMGHYPYVLIYLSLVISISIVGYVTNWIILTKLLYLLLAGGILYFLCFLPWYFVHLNHDKLAPGLGTAIKGVSVICGVTCAFVFLYFSWSRTSQPSSLFMLSSPTLNEEEANEDETEYVMVTKSGKYHRIGASCLITAKDPQKMEKKRAIMQDKLPCKKCYKQ